MTTSAGLSVFLFVFISARRTYADGLFELDLGKVNNGHQSKLVPLSAMRTLHSMFGKELNGVKICRGIDIAVYWYNSRYRKPR